MITRLVECEGRPDNPASGKRAGRIESHEPLGKGILVPAVLAFPNSVTGTSRYAGADSFKECSAFCERQLNSVCGYRLAGVTVSASDLCKPHTDKTWLMAFVTLARNRNRWVLSPDGGSRRRECDNDRDDR